jgi:Divergent InlB B-repeat domain
MQNLARSIKPKAIFLAALLGVSMVFRGAASAETVGVFYESTSDDQIGFAVKEIRAALEGKQHTVEIRGLSKLAEPYAHRRIVIGLASDGALSKSLSEAENRNPIPDLAEQAYALRTTTKENMTYWIVGGGKNGAMYGGLQIAENINFYNLTKTYNEGVSPSIEKRGIKLNLPLDEKSTTYFNGNISTGARFSIAQVWDYSFWTSWFDEMARNRYNHVSVWNNHPFTSMIKMEDYPDVAIEDVTGYPNYDTFESGKSNNRESGLIKRMTIDQKIQFWKDVMSYAKSRGFSFYLINWNLFVYGAEDKYGISKSVLDPETKAYMKACMIKLLETYPDLDGFGVTQGEAMDGSDEEKNQFLGETYGAGMAEYAKANPSRKLNFIHRWWLADEATIKRNFASLLACPNVDFDMSFKYSFAHMYSSIKPDLMGDDEFEFLEKNTLRAVPNSKVRSWLTVRNDDFYFHNWGSPQYARDYFRVIENLPGANEWFKGFYMGSDGYNPTRTFFSKLSTTQGKLEVERMWYLNKIWGRLSYDKNTSDEVFKEHLKFRLGLSSADSLFDAWRDVSEALPIVGEMIFKDFKNDQGWYPEICQGQSQSGPKHEGFLYTHHLAEGRPNANSEYASYEDTARNQLKGKSSALAAAEKVNEKADRALKTVSSMVAPADSELGIAIQTVRAMGFLSKYYSHKMRAVVYHCAEKESEKVAELRLAYPWWIRYSNLMHSMYKGMEMQRNVHFKDWHEHDEKVLEEAGGTFSSHSIKTNASNGTIVPSENASSYPTGTVITLTAQAAEGYVFSGWTGDIVGMENPIKVTVGTDMNVGAQFIPKKPAALPWVEEFCGLNPGTSDGYPTTWVASRDEGDFFRQSDRLVILGDGGVGVFETGDIDIQGAKVTISLEVQSKDGLDTGKNADFVKLYKVVDGGAPELIDEVSGAVDGIRLMKGTQSTGSNLRLKIETRVNSEGEFYSFDRLSVR